MCLLLTNQNLWYYVTLCIQLIELYLRYSLDCIYVFYCIVFYYYCILLINHFTLSTCHWLVGGWGLSAAVFGHCRNLIITFMCPIQNKPVVWVFHHTTKAPD